MGSQLFKCEIVNCAILAVWCMTLRLKFYIPITFSSSLQWFTLNPSFAWPCCIHCCTVGPWLQGQIYRHTVWKTEVKINWDYQASGLVESYVVWWEPKKCHSKWKWLPILPTKLSIYKYIKILTQLATTALMLWLLTPFPYICPCLLDLRTYQSAHHHANDTAILRNYTCITPCNRIHQDTR